MAPYQTAKPDNILKRADDLIAEHKEPIALNALYEAIVIKRQRHTTVTTLEPMMLKFIELCVELRHGRYVKEGLHQFRNSAQNTSVESIETIVTRLLDLSEGKVAEAREKADQIADVDDLEALESPESIMLSTVSGEQTKDRTDRAVVTPWLKFLWEVYRTVLDLLRNNARLELLYHQTTKKAFVFCLNYARKTEFRRLCEILRNHFQNIAKYSQQAHSIDLNDPETLERYLEVRFDQLNAAVDLELWQEAFKSVEDIYTLLTTTKTRPKPSMMANYYEKLTKIFIVGEDYLFHSAAWNKFSAIERDINKNMPDEKQARMASIVLLSALAIPIITTTKTRPGYVEADEHRLQKLNRLSMLMGLPQHPTRTGLLKEALNKNILSRVRPEIRDLYNILEVQFHPLSICKKINPIMQKLSEDKDMAKYVHPLHQVILTRLLQQLSQVYTTVKLDFVLQLASFPEPYNYDAATIEKFIMNGCKRGELSIRIDHASQSLTFETDLFAPPKGTITEGSQLQSSTSDLMRTQLSRLGVSLHAVVQMIDPSVKEGAAKAKQEVVQRALESIELEHKATLERKNIIEQRKVAIEQEAEKKKAEAEKRKAEAEERKAEAEEKRLKEEEKRRKAEELAHAQKEQTMKTVQDLNSKLGLDLKADEIASSEEAQIILNKKRIAAEKDRNDRLKTIAKRLDHTERAFRKEEISLLEKDYQKQKKLDKIVFEKTQENLLIKAQKEHETSMDLKKRFTRMLDDYSAYKQKVEERTQAIQAEKRRAAEEAIDKEKKDRIAEWRAQKDEQDRKRAQEEAERKQREEEAIRRREEKEREERELKAKQEQEAAEKIARLTKEKEEREAQNRKLDEMARKQAEREAEIERKLAERTQSSNTNKYMPPQRKAEGTETGNWRSAGRREDQSGRQRGFAPPARPDAFQSFSRDRRDGPPRDGPLRDRSLRDLPPRDGPPRDGPPRDGGLYRREGGSGFGSPAKDEGRSWRK